MSEEKKQDKSDVTIVGFYLDEWEYGLKVDDVKEILRMVEITPVPEAPPFFKGFIDLRGDITSVIDLRLRLDFPEIEHSLSAPIIIVRVNDHFMGMIVDSVSEVVTIKSSEIDKPQKDIPLPEEFIEGVVHMDDRMLTVLRLSSLVTFEHKKIIKKISRSKGYK